jgi:hypothetical protein
MAKAQQTVTLSVRKRWWVDPLVSAAVVVSWPIAAVGGFEATKPLLELIGKVISERGLIIGVE